MKVLGTGDITLFCPSTETVCRSTAELLLVYLAACWVQHHSNYTSAVHRKSEWLCFVNRLASLVSYYMCCSKLYHNHEPFCIRLNYWLTWSSRRWISSSLSHPTTGYYAQRGVREVVTSPEFLWPCPHNIYSTITAVGPCRLLRRHVILHVCKIIFASHSETTCSIINSLIWDPTWNISENTISL